MVCTEEFNKSSTLVIPLPVDVESSLPVNGTADNWSVHWTPVSVPQRSVYYLATLQSANTPVLHRVGFG